MIKEDVKIKELRIETHNLTCPHCLVHGMIQEAETPDSWKCVAPYCGREFSRNEIDKLLQNFYAPITKQFIDDFFQSESWKQNLAILGR